MGGKNICAGVSFEPQVYAALEKMRTEPQTRSKFINQVLREKLGLSPVIDAPVVDAPVVDAPVVDAPVVDASVVDAPEKKPIENVPEVV